MRSVARRAAGWVLPAVLVTATLWTDVRAEVPIEPSSTTIVLAANAESFEVKAAALLQEWLRKAFRRTDGFEIDREGPADVRMGTVIAVGRTKVAPSTEIEKLWRDGFVLRSAPSQIIIAGATPEATYYGASHFLDRYIGVRFYMPGDLFTSLPAEPPVSVPDINVTEEPFVKNCMMSGVAGFRGTGGVETDVPRPAEADWLWRNAAFRKDSPDFSHQHSMWQRFPPARYAEKYPEIYPVLNGAKYIPKDEKDQKWQPCLSEPKLVDAAVESTVDYFKQYPKRRYISFSVQDSHQFCQCERCLRLVAEAGGDKVRAYTLMNANFLNTVSDRLKQELPAAGIETNKQLVYIAYTNVREIPPIPLRGNILPVYVTKISDLGIDLSEYAERQNILTEWAASVTQMGHHDWGQGWMYLIPRLYTFMTSRFFREASARDLLWGYQHFEAYPNWGMDGAKLWITARVWWNPAVDVEQLWRQFARDMFPSAPQEMSRYFMNLETLWILMDADYERKLRKWSNQFALESPAQQRIVKECRALLDKAATTAKSTDERRRVELFSKSFRLSEYMFEFANAKQVKVSRLQELRQHVNSNIATDPMTLYLSGNTPELVKEVEAALAVITKGKIAAAAPSN